MAKLSQSPELRFNNNNTFTTYHQGGGSDVLSFDTNAIFRDTIGWYHFHFLMDSTQGTESDRFKMHVNGQQITSFNSPVYPSSNEAAAFLNSSEKQNFNLFIIRYSSSQLSYYSYLSCCS